MSIFSYFFERWHKTVKSECIRNGTPLSRGDALRLVGKYVTVYNDKRLHSAIGYITPKDKLEKKAEMIHNERDRKLEKARRRRAEARNVNRNLFSEKNKLKKHSARKTTVCQAESE